MGDQDAGYSEGDVVTELKTYGYSLYGLSSQKADVTPHQFTGLVPDYVDNLIAVPEPPVRHYSAHHGWKVIRLNDLISPSPRNHDVDRP